MFPLNWSVSVPSKLQYHLVDVGNEDFVDKDNNVDASVGHEWTQTSSEFQIPAFTAEPWLLFITFGFDYHDFLYIFLNNFLTLVGT